MFGRISTEAGRRVQYVAVAAVLSIFQIAHAQAPPPTIVDCTGTMGPYWPQTNVFPSLSQYLKINGPIGTVSLYGTCHENVYIVNGDNLAINAATSGAGILGNITVVASPDAVYLIGLTITNPAGDGINVGGSKVSLNSCNVSNNAGIGVSIENASHVVVVGSGTFDNNAGWAGAFRVFGRSFLNIAPSGPVQIQGNSQSGIWASQSEIEVGSNTVISGNINAPGVVLLGGSRAQFGGDPAAPSLVQNNSNGGIMLRENSEISLYGWAVRQNGKFGIEDGFHSQVTLAGTDVSQNQGPGVNVHSGSQVDFYPGTQNRVDGNGSLTDPTSGGIRIDGNSEAYLRGGEVSNNLGPGIRATMNSSADFAGVSIIGNAGTISCDFTSPIASDISVPFTTGCLVVRRNP